MIELTCKNHTGARYLTKNPYQRGLHFVEADPARRQLEFAEWECPCPFGDLIVTADNGVALPTPVPVREFSFPRY